MKILSPEQQLSLLQITIRFLAAEWQQLADDRLKLGKAESRMDEGQYLLGQLCAYYQAATSIQLLLNKVEMQVVDEEFAPLAIARDVVKATIEEF